MKKYLFKTFLFIFIFLLVNFLYLFLLQKIDNNFSKAVYIKNIEKESFNFIVLGNSLALDGIDTELLTNKGLRSYNFALAGSTLKSNYIQLKTYLKNNNKPKVVLLCLGSSLRDYNSLEKSESVHPIINYVYEDYKLALDNLPMIKFKWLAAENLKKIVSRHHREAQMVLGQLRIKRKVPDKTKFKNNSKKQISFKDYKGAKYLFKIDSVCNKNKINLIIIEMPGFKNTQNDITVGPNMISKSEYSLEIYNLNNKKLCSQLFDSKNDWLGNSHLNQYGAKKLTTHIYHEFLK